MPQDGSSHPDFAHPSGHYAEGEAQVAEGRRSRQHRLSDDGMGGTGDWGGAPGSMGDVGTGFGHPSGGGVHGKLGRSNTMGAAAAANTNSGGGPGAGANAAAGPGGGFLLGSSPGTGSIGNPNVSGVGASAGITGSGLANHGGWVNGGTSPSAVRHGASAGTGGSEEWPSTQNRGAKSVRHPGAGIGGPQTRRTPDLVENFQDQRHEAWHGEGVDLHRGLPSIYGGLMAPSTSGGHRPIENSRAPSRLTAGTPTPREDEMLDFGRHAAAPGRWGANDPSFAFGASELGPVRAPHNMTHPAHSSVHPSAHEPRGQIHEARAPPHDGRGALGGIGRRPDLSGVYHGH